MMMAGANAVQVGTATFLNPRAPLGGLEGIERFVRDNDLNDLDQIVGAAQPTAAEGTRLPAQHLRSAG